MSPDRTKAPHSFSPSQTATLLATEIASSHCTIVMVEDNPADVNLMKESLREHGVECRLVVVNDGDKACKLFDDIENGSAACPDLVVLDLSLPKRSGRDVLRHIKNVAACGSVPVVVLSSSNSQQDRHDTATLGAALYINKPSDLGDFMKIGLTLKSLLRGGLA